MANGNNFYLTGVDPIEELKRPSLDDPFVPPPQKNVVPQIAGNAANPLKEVIRSALDSMGAYTPAPQTTPEMATRPNIDYSQRPDYMSMDQYRASELRKRSIAKGEAQAGLEAMSQYQAPTSIFDPIQPAQSLSAPAAAEANAVDPTMRSFQTPGGGTVMMPETLPDGRPSQQVQDAVTGARTGPQGYTAEEREFIKSEMQGASQEQKAGVGVRAITSSLEKQGMSRDEIAKAIGYEPGMSKGDALRELKRVQTSRQKAQAGIGTDARTRDKVIENARFDTDESGNEIPRNTEAKASQFLQRGDDLGPDPESDQSLYESMSQSQKNQYDRTIKSMASGTRDPNSERRLKNMLEKAETARERKFMQKQAKIEKDAMTLASKKAQTAQNNEEREALKAQISAWESEMKALDDEYKKADRKRKTAINERKSEITQTITAFNKGEVQPVGEPQQQVSIQTHKEANDKAKADGLATYTIGGENYVVQ